MGAGCRWLTSRSAIEPVRGNHTSPQYCLRGGPGRVAKPNDDVRSPSYGLPGDWGAVCVCTRVNGKRRPAASYACQRTTAAASFSKPTKQYRVQSDVPNTGGGTRNRC